ncbi:MAG: sulfite exporter TauE/SafE family protein [Bacteroidetes bacterium]|nr:sulfite exporter TauE/SafE family protein [Bacteroidota bacterium]
MDIPTVLLLLLAGSAAGFLAGFFGVGGGIILVPILLYFFQSIHVSSLVSTHLAFGTSLLIVLFASLSSASQYYRNGHVVWKAVLAIGLASVVGGLVGAMIAGGLEGKVLRQIFAAVVILSAIRLFSETRKPKLETMPPLRIPSLMGTGLAVGLVSSLAGVGGGVLSIPIMHSILKFPLKKALGTSSATIVITALAAGTGYVVKGWGNTLLPEGTLGYVDWLHAIPLIAGSIPLAAVGARVANKTKVTVLKRVFALFLLVVAFRMLFF